MALRSLLTCVFLLGSVRGLAGPPPVRLVERSVLLLEVQPILSVGGQSGVLAARGVEVDPEAGGTIEFALQWPDPRESSSLRVRARRGPGAPEGEHRLLLEAELGLPGGRTARVERVLTLADGTTSLVEVYREADQGLTLAVKAERRVVGLGVPEPEVGGQVAFRLEVEGIRGDRVVPLETNHLTTFVGHPIEYSFERGQGEGRESLRLSLTPVRTSAEIVELRVEVSGTLPGAAGRALLDRQETLLASRRATSNLTVTSGEPPSGYRFRITPEF
jgi:hypothetical protein